MKQLAIIGTGIKSLSHLTREAEAYIKSAQIVCYLLNEPRLKEWIETQNKNTFCLDEIYSASSERKVNYKNIADFVFSQTELYDTVAFVIYGHPLIFATPSTWLVKKCKENDVSLTTCPGLSADNCFFADTGIDPGLDGWQSYEATMFLNSNRTYDEHSHLFLWQVGAIGISGLVSPNERKDTANLQLVKNKLSLKYPLTHIVSLYEASVYPHMEPKIVSTALEHLEIHTVSPITSLHVPPLKLR